MAGAERPEPGEWYYVTDRMRLHLDRLHQDVRRQHEALREHLGVDAGGAAAQRWGELEGLHAAGQRLHAEDTRLRAERARGVTDRAAHARFLAELAAHREALRSFRAGKSVQWAEELQADRPTPT